MLALHAGVLLFIPSPINLTEWHADLISSLGGRNRRVVWGQGHPVRQGAGD